MTNEESAKFKFNEDVVKDPTVLKVSSAEELQKLIKHPDTPEDVWVQACNELSEQGIEFPAVARSKQSPKKMRSVRIATITCGLLLIAGVALSVPLFEQVLNTKPVGQTVPSASQEAESEVREYTERIKKNPNDVGAWQNRALAYNDLKQFDLAIGDCTKAMQLDPKRPGPLNNRAMVYREAGQLESALNDCNELLKQFPKYGHGYAQRAQIYADLGKYPLAAKDMSKAIELDQNRPGYYVSRESVYKKLSEQDHFKAAEVDPDYYHRRSKSDK